MARRQTLTMSVQVDDPDGGFTRLETTVAFDSSYFPTLVDALNEFGPNMFDELMGRGNAKKSRD